MASRPLPALYTVYVLRSTVRHASLYIGSTPNPRRRLKQHNGEAKGGAARTARQSLRPWEIIVLVSGFPSMVAALKFEWALTNPHLSLHIPKDSRLAVSTQRKRNGMPKRPANSLKSIVSNLHLLTGVPSFARWPLNLHFLARESYAAWVEWITPLSPCRPDMRITTDFDEPGDDGSARGISALPLDYEPIKDYAQKARDVVSFEQEGNCLHCGQELESGKGLHVMCPNRDCTAMGHLDCWSKYALKGDECSHVIPDCCECPSCGGYVRWGDMMKELSLRIRGAEEVERLLKGRRKKTAAEAV